MNKLSLKVDALRVESFPTAREQPERGTVMAHVTGTDKNTCFCTGNGCTSVNIGCWCTEAC